MEAARRLLVAAVARRVDRRARPGRWSARCLRCGHIRTPVPIDGRPACGRCTGHFDTLSVAICGRCGELDRFPTVVDQEVLGCRFCGTPWHWPGRHGPEEP